MVSKRFPQVLLEVLYLLVGSVDRTANCPSRMGLMASKSLTENDH